jgi:two-component system nitrogen regulation sensor histidine kinase NtrY
MFKNLAIKKFYLPFVFGIVSFGSFLFLNKINFFELNHKKNIEQIQNKVSLAENEFEKLIAKQQIHAIKGFNEQSVKWVPILQKNKFFTQLYIDKKAAFWSNNSIKLLPEDIGMIQSDSSFYYSNKSGDYLIFARIYPHQKIILGILPLNYHYSVQNRYLKPHINPWLYKDASYRASPEDTSFNIYSKGNKILFGVVPTEDCKTCNHIGVYFILFFLGIFCLFFALNFLAIQIAKQYPKWSLVFLIVSTYSIRHVLLVFQIPSFLYQKTKLFDPSLYSGSSINPSLGDFLVFVLWCNWMLLYFSRRVPVNFTSANNKSYRFLLHTLVHTFMLGETVSISKILKNMVLNSTISFDFNFFPKTTIYSFIGLIALLLCFANYFVLIRKFSRANHQIKLSKQLLALSFLIANIPYIYLFYFNIHANIELYAMVLIVNMTIFLFYYYYSKNKMQRFFVPLLFLLFSATCTTLFLSYYNSLKEKNNIQHFAEKLAIDRDYNSELALNDVIDKIQKDITFQIYFNDENITLDQLKDHIIVNYLGQFTSMYNIEIYTFDRRENFYKSSDSADFSSYLEKNQDREIIHTDNDKLTLIKDNHRSAYLVQVPIMNQEELQGKIILHLTQKQIIHDNLYPELLMKESELSNEINDNVNFAVYSDKQLISQKGSYPYPYLFKFNVAENAVVTTVVDKKQYEHSIFILNNKHIVVSKETSNLLSPISLFSYIFCFFLVIYCVGLVLYNCLSLFKNFKFSINKIRFLSLRSKINMFIFILVLFFFTIIGFISYSYFSNKYENYHKDYLLNKQKTVLSSIHLFISDIQKQNKEEITLTNYKRQFDYLIPRLSESNNIDINIYNKNGHLLVSSQQAIFENGLISDLINPSSYSELLAEMEHQQLLTERIGDLEYVSISSPIRSDNGTLLGYINIPYFSKSKNLQSDFSSFVVALLNVYVILLLLTILLAFFISNNITKPLKIISEKMTNIDLRGENTPINYAANDELGELVARYNSMQVALQKSASNMAQSEREAAWQEMAKQVAHEIKNPLTPMKLNIQYLQKTIQDNPDNVIPLAGRVSKTLVEQIDNLVDIANAFSNFAKKNEPKNEIINLNNLLNNICDLFKQEPNTQITFKSFVDHPIIYFDRNQLVRAFNNIMKNAVQAKKESEDIQIDVLLYEMDNLYKISITDNGEGIPEEVRKKIFEPNFTTKNSGTGLGLSISKKNIEACGGKIYFESTMGIGTSFFIEFPKHSDTATPVNTKVTDI